MNGKTSRLGLYELLAPQFLAGFTFPEYVDRYLSTLGVDELHTAHDGSAVVYSGRCSFTGAAGAAPERAHHDPSGAVFEWGDVTLDFRLTLPRDGAAFVSTAVGAPMVGSPGLNALFNAFGAVEGAGTAPTEYPGVRFRLELMASALIFHLGSSWRPGMLDSNGRVVPDPARTTDDVRFVLPKVLLAYEQSDDLTTPPAFELSSWGSGGFDAPHDLAAGELVRMEPPLAIHESGRIGFGVDQVLLDLSENSTPPEILQFFGTDEAFRGVYVRSARVYYADADKDWAVNVGAQDVLVSFAGEVSLETSLDVIGPQSKLEVTVRLFEGVRPVSYVKGTATGTIVPGHATILNTGVVQLLVSGGIPPYAIQARLGDGANAEELWDPAARQAPLSPGAPATLRPAGPATLHILVTDGGTPVAGGTRQTYLEDIDLTIQAALATQDGAPADRPADTAPRADAVFEVTSRNPAPLPQGYSLSCTPSSSGLTETIVVTGGQGPTVTVGGTVRTPDPRGAVSFDVPEGTDLSISVSWPPLAGAPGGEFRLGFTLDRPEVDATALGLEQQICAYAAGTESPADFLFDASRPTGGGPPASSVVAALQDWVTNQVPATAHFQIQGHASFENVANQARDQKLSEARLEIAKRMIRAARPGAVFDSEQATGHTKAKGSSDPHADRHRVAIITAPAGPPSAPAATLQAHISRAPASTPQPVQPPEPPATPPPEPNRKPNVFRRAGLRVRLERNVLVLAEVSGRLDLETDMEAALRQQTGSATGDLGLAPTTAAVNENPEDGVVDFLLSVTYDPATHQLAERLSIGAAPEDRNGLLQMTNSRSGSGSSAENVFKDTFGALLVMAPVINTAAAAVDPGSAGDWVAVGVSLAVPAAVGALGVFKTDKVTLYGGELKLRQNVPPDEAVAFTDAGVTFDYSVEFGIEIEQLDIATTKPLKVRYRAVGFNLRFADGIRYQPIFDTSKGYELDLSDPGLFRLPSPLGDLLKILSARIARVNPLTLEVDLGLKVDLGVVTVDRFKVRWPLDPLGPPSILPSGVKLDISNVLVGSGYVNIIEPAPNETGELSGGGFEGTADVSLVPLKLRISASLGVRMLNIGQRKAVAVFAGLIVELPAPIPLAQSGLGIFGFSGLFAMHYKRDERPPDGTAVGPALRWLIRAEGEPARLVVEGDTLWVPELDRWSVGAGMILGTTDGFVLNLRGMLVLELPGPRILIFIKLQIVAEVPSLGEGGLDVGILGVIDLDFARKQLTVGLIADLGLGEVLRVTVPTELFVKLDDPRIWHFYLGKHTAPATALVLNLVRASGYFMIEGDRIEDWQGTDPPTDLPGLALAAGLEASIVLGDESVGLYLRVAAGAHLGISFSPVLFLAGRVFLEGELRLFIVSIEARGDLQAQVLVESPDHARTFIDGRICGKVSFFFFSVEGCVRHSIGVPVTDPPAADLVKNVFLQSHAPVLTAGQGGDRPIDASLGDAARDASSGPTVPIDTVPVIQFGASPLVAGATSFTTAIPGSPQQTADGFISVGGDREVRYDLRQISLSPPLPTAPGLPPATWRTERAPNPNSADTSIDLALMSRAPTVAERALERSTDLDASITRRWSALCDPVAPPTCILFTFCGQPLGPSGESGEGWTLHGTPAPDPPGTSRSAPPDTRLEVDEPTPAPASHLLGVVLADAGLGMTVPAEIIGPNVEVTPPDDPPPEDRTCITFPRRPPQPGANPLVNPGARFTVFDHAGALEPDTHIQTIAGITGLRVGFRTDIALDEPSPLVELELVHFSSPAKVTAIGAGGMSLVTMAMTPDQATLQTLVLRTRITTPIARVRIDAPQNEALLLRVCFATPPQGLKPSNGRSPALRTRRVRRDARAARLAAEFRSRQAARQALEAALLSERRAAAALAAPPGLARAAAPRAVGTTTPDTRHCFRALKLPLRVETKRQDPLKPEREARKQAKRLGDDRWIVLRTGRAVAVTLLLAVEKSLLTQRGLLLEQLAPDGAVLDSRPASGLGPTFVTGTTTGLPADWLDPSGTWLSHVEPVAAFLADPAFAGLIRVVVTVKPLEECDRLRLRVPAKAPVVPPPGVLVGVVQVCPLAEQERVATDTEIRSGQIKTLVDYLTAGTPVPLLKPDTPYTLSVRYDVSARLAGGSPSSQGQRTQSFRFRTDGNPPPRLDPWVLGTTPDDEERFHFTDDPLKLVFNDLAVVQLYAAYGRKLRFVLRSADGVPIPTHEIAALDPVEAGLSSPYREFLEGMVAAGELPCGGKATAQAHGAWTAPVPLRPLMDYTLDVELDPQPPAPPATQASTPLFRRTFTTSRFASVAALADDLRGRRIRHRALTARIAGLPTDAVAVASDEELQAALMAAGEQALPAPAEGGIVVYWAQRASKTRFTPHAILIDAAEPLWRTRQEPRLETVPDQLDPAYKRVVPTEVDALRLVEQGSAAVASFVHSPGGARTLAVLADAAVGTSDTLVSIAAERPASTLFGLAQRTTTVLTLTLGPQAPWETDDA
ncbi:hypothetical protein [Streptomyces sp. NPDC057280]|uniref:hypothetical protein n=1 Tax=Streptomyces sp. NPDC057280 TaxID=3346081 RepID=UPI00362B887D